MKKSLLIEINYKGSPIETNGEVAIESIGKILSEKYQYTEINYLRENGNENEDKPTKDNIIKYIKKLISVSPKCKEIWIHYLGHSTLAFDEKNEFIKKGLVPIDHLDSGYIFDEDLRALIDQIKCNLYLIIDCCYGNYGYNENYTLKIVDGRFIKETNNARVMMQQMKDKHNQKMKQAQQPTEDEIKIITEDIIIDNENESESSESNLSENDSLEDKIINPEIINPEITEHIITGNMSDEVKIVKKNIEPVREEIKENIKNMQKEEKKEEIKPIVKKIISVYSGSPKYNKSITESKKNISNLLSRMLVEILEENNYAVSWDRILIRMFTKLFDERFYLQTVSLSSNEQIIGKQNFFINCGNSERLNIDYRIPDEVKREIEERKKQKETEAAKKFKIEFNKVNKVDKSQITNNEEPEPPVSSTNKKMTDIIVHDPNNKNYVSTSENVYTVDAKRISNVSSNTTDFANPNYKRNIKKHDMTSYTKSDSADKNSGKKGGSNNLSNNHNTRKDINQNANQNVSHSNKHKVDKSEIDTIMQKNLHSNTVNDKRKNITTFKNKNSKTRDTNVANKTEEFIKISIPVQKIDNNAQEKKENEIMSNIMKRNEIREKKANENSNETGENIKKQAEKNDNDNDFLLNIMKRNEIREKKIQENINMVNNNENISHVPKKNNTAKTSKEANNEKKNKSKRIMTIKEMKS
jgi:hypothetical protein